MAKSSKKTKTAAGKRGAKTAKTRAAVKPKPPSVDTFVGRFRVSKPTEGRLTGSKVDARIQGDRSLAPLDASSMLSVYSVFPLDDRAVEMIEVCAVWRALGGTLAEAEKAWRAGRPA